MNFSEQKECCESNGADNSLDMDLLDPEKHSIDEVRAQFERYKKRFEEQQGVLQLHQCAGFNADLVELQEHVKSLRANMDKFHEHSTAWQQEQMKDLNEIELAHSVAYDIKINDDIAKNKAPNNEKILVVTCGSSACLFENCQRRVDSQLLLLHYLIDHSDQFDDMQKCHGIFEGERVVISFNPKKCHFRQNQVLGLLTYGGTLEQKIAQPNRKLIFNSFLPKEHLYMQSHVPIVVLICKTAASAVVSNKLLAEKMQMRASKADQIFVMWLVTPNNKLHLNATLCLCGRDAAVKACSIVTVRPVQESQNTCRFMPVDANYWRLSYNEVQKISNGFRDELHLEIGLTELSNQNMFN
ncbi:uncharacterized protein LOC115634558 [Scaptodrosophila lebanonensis]|uniref:Uncharacterized protein LOC115634558 n=1 Tax=Drosophila lebanonensis TaxID=7225 RepID=A0A6J2UJ26_DROLE|nr:uncharacterized protein LOC115634558 [Scaptodrosophila lebanonensis]